MGRTTDNNSQFLQGENSVSVLAKTNDDKERVLRSGWKAVLQCHSQKASPPLYQCQPEFPQGRLLPAHPWSDLRWGFCSFVLVGTVVTGAEWKPSISRELSRLHGNGCWLAMLWVWLHENCEVWLDEAAVILRFALCECGSIHPQCEVDVSLQGSAGMPRGMTKRRSSSSPHQNQSNRCRSQVV